MEIVFQSLHGCPFILGSVSHFFSVWHPDSYLLWLSVDFLALQMAAFPHPPQLTQQQGVESPSPRPTHLAFTRFLMPGPCGQMC